MNDQLPLNTDPRDQIPWLRKPTEPSELELEKEYYEVNGQLASCLDELVYLNKLKELNELDNAELDSKYQEIMNNDYFEDKSESEIESFLVNHLEKVKRQALLRDFLPMALPVLRAIHIENASLTESEYLVLNNLKKLYSRYNEHPANIKRLISEYHQSIELLDKKLLLLAQIETLISIDLKEKVDMINANVKEMTLLQNEKEAQSSEKREQYTNLLRQAYKSLYNKMNRISTLCDLLPRLVLCHPSNWYNDTSLREIIEKCQDVSEAFPETQSLEIADSLNLEELLSLDISHFEVFSSDIQNSNKNNK